MASPKSVKAGEAFIELNVKDNLQKGLRAADRRLRKFGQKLTKIGNILAKLGIGITAFGAAVAAAFIPAIKEAGDFAETLSRFQTIFRDLPQGAADAIEDMAKRIGRGKRELMNIMSDFGGLASDLGLTEQGELEFAAKVTEMTLDFGSFNNLEDADAGDKILSALSGSVETLRRYGVLINEAGIAKAAKELGFMNEELTDQQKVLARLKIIEDRFAEIGVLGDATKTAGSFNNQLKRMKGNLDNLKAAVGKEVMESLADVLVVINGALQYFQQLAKENPELFKKLALYTALTIALGAAVLTVAAGFIILGGAIAGSLFIMGIFAKTGLLLITALTFSVGRLAGKLIVIKQLFKAIFGAKIIKTIIHAVKAFRIYGKSIQAAMAAQKAGLGIAGKTLANVIKVENAFKRVGIGFIRIWRSFKLFGAALARASIQFIIFWELFEFALFSIGKAFTAMYRTAVFAIKKVSENWSALVTLIKANDLEKAISVVAKVGELVWLKMIIEMKKAWADITAYFPNKFSTAVTYVAQAFLVLRKWFQNIILGFKIIWAGLVSSLVAGAKAAMGVLQGKSFTVTYTTEFAKSFGEFGIDEQENENQREMEEGILALEQELESLKKSREANTEEEEERLRILEEELRLLRGQAREIEKANRENGESYGNEDEYGNESYKQLGSRGIFNASAIRSLRTGDTPIDQRIEENTRKTAEELRKIYRGLTTQEAGKILIQ